MTTFFLDFEGGSDAADGLSFANRWKTIQSGATAARTAPGDIIRVMATPYPQSPGNATWTDNSGTVAWAAAKNVLINDCESGWVASANVTATFPTGQKHGSALMNLAFAAGFTTGKAAYFALPSTLDLSAFEQISFWFRSNTGAPTFSVKLCSDAVGDVPVDTFSFTFATGVDYTVNVMKPTVGNKGAALGTTINSIAIYADADPGTAIWRFDNIVAAMAAGSANEVTHRMLISKNTVGEPEWYNISGITDTGVVLGNSLNSDINLDPGMPYRGATESVATYMRQPIVGGTSLQMTIQEGGTAGNPITYSGGWNRTDMSTQDGETWISGENGVGLLSMGSNRTWVNTEKFGFANFNSIALDNTNGTQTHDIVGFVGCGNSLGAATYSTTQAGRPKITVDHVWGCNAGMLGTYSRPIDLTIRLLHGDCDSNSNSGAFSGVANFGHLSTYKIDRIENNRSNGIYNDGKYKLSFRGTTFKNNLVSDLRFASSIIAKIELEDCELLSATPVSVNTPTIPIEILETRIGGDPLVNKITNSFSYYQSQAVTVHSGTIAWEVGFLQGEAYYVDTPILYPLASVACNAGTLVTVKAWLRRDSTNVGAGLHIQENPVQGIVETTVYMTAAVDTWEEVTLTFTPATSGVFDIWAAAYGPVGNVAYFDGDVTVTQV